MVNAEVSLLPTCFDRGLVQVERLRAAGAIVVADNAPAFGAPRSPEPRLRRHALALELRAKGGAASRALVGRALPRHRPLVPPATAAALAHPGTSTAPFGSRHLGTRAAAHANHGSTATRRSNRPASGTAPTRAWCSIRWSARPGAIRTSAPPWPLRGPPAQSRRRRSHRVLARPRLRGGPVGRGGRGRGGRRRVCGPRPSRRAHHRRSAGDGAELGSPRRLSRRRAPARASAREGRPDRPQLPRRPPRGRGDDARALGRAGPVTGGAAQMVRRPVLPLRPPPHPDRPLRPVLGPGPLPDETRGGKQVGVERRLVAPSR